MEQVAIIDYGMGNINSIRNMLRYLGYDSILTNKTKDIMESNKIILPGVGHFGKAMDNIRRLELEKILGEAVIDRKTPILGICLGMQLLTSYSEEGDSEGLDWIKGKVKKFSFNDNLLKIPHMGWDFISPNNESKLLVGTKESSRFYFVHSYYVACDHDQNSIAKTEYGFKFDSIIQNNNIVGTQFHPEKSHRFGMQILRNFMEEF